MTAHDVERIERAFGRIVERLNRCGHERGCCCDEDCDFDDEVRDCDPDDVPGRLAVIERRTKEAAECFWSLIGEYTVVSAPARRLRSRQRCCRPGCRCPCRPQLQSPTAAARPLRRGPASSAPRLPPPRQLRPPLPLAASASAGQGLQDEIEAISKAAAEGSWDPPKLYAAVLVARRHLKDVWRGFVNVNEYMDCLCRALTCMIKGHAAIGELTRQDAVDQCFRESWKAGCKYLEDNTVDEVLAEYLRVCAEEIVGVPDPGLDQGVIATRAVMVLGREAHASAAIRTTGTIVARTITRTGTIRVTRTTTILARTGPAAVAGTARNVRRGRGTPTVTTAVASPRPKRRCTA